MGSLYRALGYWQIYSVRIRYTSFDKAHMEMGIGIGISNMVKAEEEWKIQSIHTEEKLKIRSCLYEPETRYQRYFDGSKEESWEPIPERTGNYRCQSDIYEIESIFAHWLVDMRGNSCEGFVLDYMQNPIEECNFSLQANGAEQSRTWKGTEQVKAMAGKMSGSSEVDFATGIHMAALPVIEVSDDGNYAEARFLDFNCALRDIVMTKTATGMTLDNQQVDEASLPYLNDYDQDINMLNKSLTVQRFITGLSRYYHRFVKANGEWKLYDFCWTPQVVFPDEHFSKEESTGWGTDKDRKPFPVLGTKIV